MDDSSSIASQQTIVIRGIAANTNTLSSIITSQPSVLNPASGLTHVENDTLIDGSIQSGCAGEKIDSVRNFFLNIF